MAGEERLVNLNRADEHALTQLPRIGADKARRIVQVRAVRKGFRDWEDFSEASGIGPEDVEAIRSRAWIGPGAEQAEGMPVPRRPGRRPTAVRRPHR